MIKTFLPLTERTHRQNLSLTVTARKKTHMRTRTRTRHTHNHRQPHQPSQNHGTTHANTIRIQQIVTNISRMKKQMTKQNMTKVMLKPTRKQIEKTCMRLSSEKLVIFEHLEQHFNPMLGSSFITNFLLTMNGVELSLAREVHQSNHWILPIWSLRKVREQRVPESSNHSRFLMKLFSSSNPEGNSGGNQPRDGSVWSFATLPKPPPEFPWRCLA